MIRPLQLNVLGLLGSKLARAIAIKRAILGGIISLAPLRPRPRPQPTSRPSYTPRPVTQPPPRPVTAPPTQPPPSDSYGAPLAPPISGGTGYSGAGSGTGYSGAGSGYHSDVGAVIQVVANSGTGTGRFPSGDRHQSSSDMVPWGPLCHV